MTQPMKQRGTAKLYYADSYTTEFDATIAAICTVDGRPALLLDETFFYPTSGGQAHDLGLLGERGVVDVYIDENGNVAHLLDESLDDIQIGQSIHGTIDWARRYDHMQQHSAQHLLSHAFHKILVSETVSVHFGTVDSTIDLESELLTPAQLDEIEAYANDIVYANIPIRAYMRSEAEIVNLLLRRPPKVQGEIRIVEIDKIDYSACGGTHCRQTGELGPIKLVRQERSRGNTRIAFAAGRRALDDYRQKHQVTVEAANLFSTETSLIPEAISRSMAQNKALTRRVNLLTDRLLVHDANTLVGSAQKIGHASVVAQILPQYEVDDLRKLALLLQEKPNTLSLLVTTANDKATIFFARSGGLEIHMGNLLRDTLREFGGGGGGRPELAQGGGVPSEKAQTLLDFAIAQLAEM